MSQFLRRLTHEALDLQTPHDLRQPIYKSTCDNRLIFMRQNAILTLILILMSGFQAHSFAYLTNHQVNLLTNMNDESGPFAMTIWRDNDRHKEGTSWGRLQILK